jgi:hypothetical protein
MKTPLARLERLEAAAHPGACPTCHNHPTRIVAIDEETGEETGASLPADGCPGCGRPIWRELQIVGIRGEALP